MMARITDRADEIGIENQEAAGILRPLETDRAELGRLMLGAAA